MFAEESSVLNVEPVLASKTGKVRAVAVQKWLLASTREEKKSAGYLIEGR